ncbi:galactosyltransferase-related protein [uncultured Tenacibaculum sp.]|uniref:galactosyltransferase-related protein n=1 Tax=uncultured Tenacibaculum sp. TaxID=174713 RepID=UPI00261F9D98|nr:galactosyltransferase-related protein [uncultured Tenacibaculum sp.]
MEIPISKKLFLIDNTSDSKYKNLSYNTNEAVHYVENNKNIGFGSGHNKVIPLIKGFSKYHLVLNPDVFFEQTVISDLIIKIGSMNDVAMIAPKVQFPNGEEQFTVRKYPSVLDLFIRKTGVSKNSIYKQEYRDQDLTQPFFPEAIHGCFMLFKTEDFIALNGFDERYFLYMEDIDICKKIDQIGKKKLYYPKVKVSHVLKQGSSKNIKLFLYHLSSAFKYFVKWL